MASRWASLTTALATALALFASRLPTAEAYIVPPPRGTVDALTLCFDEKVYSANSHDAPAVIAASFAGQGTRVAFGICRDADGNDHYFLRAPRPNRNGVCRTFEEEIYLAADSDRIRVQVAYDGTAEGSYITLKGWTRSIPQGWAALHYTSRTQEYGFPTNTDCPLGDDARYMRLTNVTDDMLKSFQNAWSKIAASRQSLETAVAKVPAVFTPIEHFNTPERQQKLRERTIEGVLAGTEIPQDFRCDTNNDCSVSFNSFSIDFALTPDGIVLTKLFALWRV